MKKLPVLKYVLYLLLVLLTIYPELIMAKNIDFNPEVVFSKKFQEDWVDINLTGLVTVSGVTLPELYFTFNALKNKVNVGRKYLKLGPGHFSQLMLSDKETPLNIISYQGEFTWKEQDIDYFQMMAFLDEGVNKQLFIHRLSNNTLINNLEFGLSEAMIASHKIHPAYYNPLPFWPYYLTAKIIGINSDYNRYEDKYIGADFTYHFNNGAQIYGELLIDEYAQVVWANNPDKRAHLFGVYYPLDSQTELRAEYSNVFNYVYLHRYPENSYSYNDKYIGHWLGHDGDVFDIQVKRDIGYNQNLKVGLRLIRKGIGDMETDYGPDHHDKKFLSTITEEKYLLRSGYQLKTGPNFQIDIEMELGKSIQQTGIEEEILNLGCNLNIQL